MKIFLILLSIMTTTAAISQDAKATTIKNTFNQETSVQISIKADVSIIWTLLTNGADITRWNSTLTHFEGDIVEGNKIKFKSILDSNRVFKVKVKGMVTEKSMHWGDGKGDRWFTISDNGDGTCTFSMKEKIGGLMFPMYAKYLPPFEENFKQFASDLKNEAELIYNIKN